MDNKTFIFDLQDNESYDYAKIIINYRQIINIYEFIIKYRIKHYWTDKFKYNDNPIDILYTNHHKDNNENNLEKMLNNFIYIKLNII